MRLNNYETRQDKNFYLHMQTTHTHTHMHKIHHTNTPYRLHITYHTYHSIHKNPPTILPYTHTTYYTQHVTHILPIFTPKPHTIPHILYTHFSYHTCTHISYTHSLAPLHIPYSIQSTILYIDNT